MMHTENAGVVPPVIFLTPHDTNGVYLRRVCVARTNSGVAAWLSLTDFLPS